MNQKEITRPECPKCKKPMLFSMCIAYKEHVCIPCGESAEMFNGLKETKTTQKEEDRLKKLYSDDIQKLAYERGGASCGSCNKKGGNNCKDCKLQKEFKYWDKKS